MNGIVPMKYMLEEKSKQIDERQKMLINIWVESDTFEEFIVRANLEVPDARRFEMRAFKIYYFKRCHPALYKILWLSGMAMSLLPSIIFNCPLAAVVGMSSYLLIVMVHSVLHGDLIDSIETDELRSKILPVKT